MRKLFKLSALFIFGIMLFFGTGGSYAQTCVEIMPQYDDEVVSCAFPGSAGYSVFPGSITPACSSAGTICSVLTTSLCENAENSAAGYTCEPSGATCDQEYGLVCGIGQKCCLSDPADDPDCSTGPAYQSCRAANSCSGYGGTGWDPINGFSCVNSNPAALPPECCIRLCVQGVSDTTHYCDTDPVNPGDGEVLDRFCGGGLTCYVAGSTPQYQCEDLGGECVDYPQDCIDTGGILDDEPVCSGGATCCLPDNGPIVTCTGSNRTCMLTDDYIANGVQCPNGFPDPNFNLSCGYDSVCCEAREACTPTTANGCYEYQGGTAAAVWVCDACGDGGCGTDRRCAPTSSGGYACVPCTVGDTCSSPGQCNEVAGCGPGERCHEYATYSRCEVDPECGQQLLLDYPYQGPIITFNDLLSRIYSLLYPIGIALGLFFIAKAGYTIMMSEGNPTKISQGKEELTSAVLGTLFILLSLVILRVIIRALLGATI